MKYATEKQIKLLATLLEERGRDTNIEKILSFVNSRRIPNTTPTKEEITKAINFAYKVRKIEK